MKKIIIDTDIGTDVDDALALALAMKSKEIDLQAVTTVSGDVNLRARIALKLLKLAGFEGVPVAKGIEKPLLRDKTPYWSGHEGHGLLRPEDETLKPVSAHAVDLIISKVMSMKGEITLVPIGPLTNVATAIIKEPEIIGNAKEVVLMGGVTRLCEGFNLPYREYNINSDPEAAKVVFNSGMPITMVPLDVTMRAPIEREDLKRISGAKTPLTDAVASMVEYYLNLMRRDYTWLHDPLAVAVSIDRSLVRTMDMKVLVETKGEFTVGQTIAVPAKLGEAAFRICMDVDVKRFKNFFMERICATS